MRSVVARFLGLSEGGVDKLKRRREEAENGVVLHGGLYGPPYELPVGQNVGHGFSGKVIGVIHKESFS